MFVLSAEFSTAITLANLIAWLVAYYFDEKMAGQFCLQDRFGDRDFCPVCLGGARCGLVHCWLAFRESGSIRSSGFLAVRIIPF